MLAKTNPNPDDLKIGQRIRTRRVQLSLSQEKLGDAIGLTFQQVQKYEKGTNRVGGSRMVQIAKALQCDIGYFFADFADGQERPAELIEMDDRFRAFNASTFGRRIALRFAKLPNDASKRALCELIEALTTSD